MVKKKETAMEYESRTMDVDRFKPFFNPDGSIIGAKEEILGALDKEA